MESRASVRNAPGITDYHAKLLAHELTLRHSSDSMEKLASAVAGAQVDLNPHQVDAALFAFESPLSKGAVLADEVGLGKTIEAGLVLAQKWAERKRRLLVIVPSNLRKQWLQELTEKFFLPCEILESKNYNQAIRQGIFRPFEAKEAVVICSYQFARSKAGDVANAQWDLVVIDEAHRLRNVYKPTNIIANTLKLALASRPKLLLTATPLQNSILELFGLVSVIDDRVFGDLQSAPRNTQAVSATTSSTNTVTGATDCATRQILLSDNCPARSGKPRNEEGHGLSGGPPGYQGRHELNHVDAQLISALCR